MTAHDAHPAEPEYLRPGEAARILHISPKTIDRWADLGYVPCLVTLGGHRRFPKNEILAVADQMATDRAVPHDESGPRRKRATTR